MSSFLSYRNHRIFRNLDLWFDFEVAEIQTCVRFLVHTPMVYIWSSFLLSQVITFTNLGVNIARPPNDNTQLTRKCHKRSQKICVLKQKYQLTSVPNYLETQFRYGTEKKSFFVTAVKWFIPCWFQLFLVHLLTFLVLVSIYGKLLWSIKSSAANP